MRFKQCMLATLVCLVAIARQDRAGLAAEPASNAEEVPGPINLRTPTLGGKQFWADELVLRDWRIQRNVITGHYRLLDPGQSRHAWGKWEHCRNRLDELAADKGLQPIAGRVVIVLHGLFRSRHAMEKLCAALEEHDDWTVVNVGYPSTRGAVADHAESLARVVDNLGPAVTEVNFVAHSLGNIVVRRYLADREQAHKSTTPRVGRIVMLGPPNLGAELAVKLVRFDVSGQIVGAVGRELGAEFDELEPNLATPECEFGILAGGRNTERGLNPLIEGDDDLVVTVASTRLPGACDFRVMPVWHTTMMNDPAVQEYTIRFLKEGWFESRESRQPIPLEAESR